jgi:Squalene-hopene cyclase C-terminal domain
MSRGVIDSLRAVPAYLLLPGPAKMAHWRDHFGPPANDLGVERAIEAAVAWLGCAQDNAAPQDGGVARHFSLITGWSASYPETTGYIVPTMLEYARSYGQEAARQRAKRMLDWLVSIQFPNGAFQAGMVDAKPLVPVTFNTGQILLGLASGAHEFRDEYREAMLRAADWLVETQDADGCWRRYPTPFARPGEKTYETHVAWGLLEAARLEPHKPYAAAALANVRWALGFQRESGWFEQCCLTDPSQPLSHTLGYALRGLVEAYRFTREAALLHACQKTADGLLTAVRGDGFLPGRLQADWRGAVRWSCLTGSAQIAICWLLLYQETGKIEYRDAAFAVNRYVRRTMRSDGPPEIRGAIKGSFPIYGDYGPYQYLNWACKFFIDSNLLEKNVRQLAS